MNIKYSPAAHSDKKRQKKNRKGSVTSTVIGDTYSVKWRFYFWFHGEKQRCISRDFFNWLPANPRYAMYKSILYCMNRQITARKKDIKKSLQTLKQVWRVSVKSFRAQHNRPPIHRFFIWRDEKNPFIQIQILLIR